MNKKNEFTALTENQLAKVYGGSGLGPMGDYVKGIPALLKGIVAGLKDYHKHPIKGFK